MAKKKKTGGGHHKPRKHNPKNPHRRPRRRNPSGTFGDRVGRLAMGAAVALDTGVAVVFVMSKAPAGPLSEYGIPIATGLVGAAVYRTMPTLGAGMALGAASPFVLPLASKLIIATTPSTPSATAAGIARSMRTMRAVSMGRGRMGAIDMGAVDMAYA